MNGSNKENRQQLEREAEEARARLAATLGELDKRRHRIFDVKSLLRKHAGELEIVGAGLALTGTLAWVLRWRQQRHQLTSRRLAALRLLWQHPERLKADRSLPAEILRGVVINVATFASGEYLRQAIRRLIAAD